MLVTQEALSWKASLCKPVFLELLLCMSTVTSVCVLVVPVTSCRSPEPGKVEEYCNPVASPAPGFH